MVAGAMLGAVALSCVVAGQQSSAEHVVLSSSTGVEIVFAHRGSGWDWTGYRDQHGGRRWQIDGPGLSLQPSPGHRTDLGDTGFARIVDVGHGVVRLETEVAEPAVAVRRTFSFAADGRTLRIRTSLRAIGEPLTIQRVGLLELQVPGDAFRLTGPSLVSDPVFGHELFAGVEVPSAWCQADGDRFWLAQHSYTRVGSEWVDLPSVVFGSVSGDDLRLWGEKEGLRRAFLRYLDTVRLKPRDIHVHYNNWWTMPVPFSETDVLGNIDDLTKGLYANTGFFFDSYAMDMGWSDPHTVWQVASDRYPEGFSRIRDALAKSGAKPGLWVSPSSLYPPALDNAWLRENGYEVIPLGGGGLAACLAKGGRYQQAFRDAVVAHVRAAGMGHVKFDGFVPGCSDAAHGHKLNEESYLPIAEGLAEVFDAVRQVNPDIALEPTCFGYSPSPWWLLHVPFIIGPFGDDSPHGRCPAPEWLEAMTTGRDIANLSGRDSFLLPNSALECFDVLVQCPGDIRNHAVMAVGRGRWFVSCYINPKFMDAEQWRFFAAVMRWARANRESLMEPVPIGGDPAKRQAYGYDFRSRARRLVCLRNPWIEEQGVALPSFPTPAGPLEVRLLYPRREVLARAVAGAPLPPVRLGPYEAAFVEIVPSGDRSATSRKASPPPDPVQWAAAPGHSAQALLEGTLTLTGARSAELCVLCTGTPRAVDAKCSATLDGKDLPLRRSQSDGSFSATGAAQTEHWVWFIAEVPNGPHHLSITANTPTGAEVGVYVRGEVDAGPALEPFGPGPEFPQRTPLSRGFARTLLPLASAAGAR